MRRMARVDGNQAAIVKDLRQIGCEVQHLHTIGKGCPDLLVAFKGVWYLVEVKDGEKPAAQQKLTPDEVAWH
jgi:Holliday junction resolvase